MGTTAVAAARAAGVGASYAARTLASSWACELGSSRAAVRRARCRLCPSGISGPEAELDTDVSERPDDNVAVQVAVATLTARLGQEAARVAGGAV